MTNLTIRSEMRHVLRAEWHRFIDDKVSLRPALYQYCRKLTYDVWDAEDLVQETLLRAFASLAK